MKIGFACKYWHHDRDLAPKALKEIEQSFNGRATTARWLTDNPDLAYERLYSICLDNVKAVGNLIEYVSKLEPTRRMVRLSSDLLPMYTHKVFKHFYSDTDILKQVAPKLLVLGKLCRSKGIKVSMHPGQFCVLASDKPDVVDRSIEEFEAHVDVIRMMGFGKKKLDFKCNIHLSGRGGLSEFKKTLKRLSPEARRVITLENDEFSACLDDILPISHKVGIVLDIHHYWISTGTYISPKDPRLVQIEDSWNGQRPTMHYSYSRHEHVNHILGKRPDLDTLLKTTHRSKLRAHSDTYPNSVMNSHALEFLPRFDIMCEAKWKNLASYHLHQQALRTKVIK